jgi:sugar lactone lactonase YvrE
MAPTRRDRQNSLHRPVVAPRRAPIRAWRRPDAPSPPAGRPVARTIVALAAGIVGPAACIRLPTVLTPNAEPVTTVANVGFVQPENVVYDSVADVYLVSNLGGGGSAKDDNGFVSRVAHDGRVLDLDWISGQRDGIELHSPKGLAIRGDTLAIADLGAVHLVDRRGGALLRTVPLPGPVMNDVAFGPDASIWVTGTGPTRDRMPVDTTQDLDAIWRVMPDGSVRAVARGPALERPDGLVTDGDAVLVATFGGNRIERVSAAPGKAPATFRSLPAGRLDGLRRVGDGSLLVTSWDAGVVWRLWEDNEPHRVIAGLTSPTGIAIDTRRHLLAVTSMQRNELYLVPLH